MFRLPNCRKPPKRAEIRQKVVFWGPNWGSKTVRLTIQGAERKNPKNSCRLQWI